MKNNEKVTYYQRNQAKILQKTRNYYEKNKEKIKEDRRNKYSTLSIEDKKIIKKMERMVFKTR